ncbi:MAG: hypothetical protein ACFFC0_03530, partial [Promethearchaeota archaeon]
MGRAVHRCALMLWIIMILPLSAFVAIDGASQSYPIVLDSPVDYQDAIEQPIEGEEAAAAAREAVCSYFIENIGQLKNDAVKYYGSVPPPTPSPGEDIPGWFCVIEERLSEARFGLDERDPDIGIGDPLPFDDWSDLTWEFLNLPSSNYIDNTGLLVDTQPMTSPPENPKDVQWLS